MNSKIKKLVKKLTTFTSYNKKEIASFLLEVFYKSGVFELTNKKQKFILENLILYFDTLVCGNQNYKVRNKHFNDDDILNHIENKTFDLVSIKDKVKLY